MDGHVILEPGNWDTSFGNLTDEGHCFTFQAVCVRDGLDYVDGAF
jgi:hypothetical protein